MECLWRMDLSLGSRNTIPLKTPSVLIFRFLLPPPALSLPFHYFSFLNLYILPLEKNARTSHHPPQPCKPSPLTPVLPSSIILLLLFRRHMQALLRRPLPKPQTPLTDRPPPPRTSRNHQRHRHTLHRSVQLRCFQSATEYTKRADDACDTEMIVVERSDPAGGTVREERRRWVDCVFLIIRIVGSGGRG